MVVADREDKKIKRRYSWQTGKIKRKIKDARDRQNKGDGRQDKKRRSVINGKNRNLVIKRRKHVSWKKTCNDVMM